MKIAVLSDIHGNYPALETVIDHIERWQPDRVYVAGDIVNRGPRSLDCLRLLLDQQNQGWHFIRGNHEDYVTNQDKSERDTDPVRQELDQFVVFTYQQVKSELAVLQSLPEIYSESSIRFGEVRMMHASMWHNRDGIYPETSDRDLIRKISPPPSVFITGHTHRSLIRSVGETLVVNVGSVGLPFDGDHRTGYAQIQWQDGNWRAKIIRLTYDIAQAEQDFYAYGYLAGAGPLARLVLLELETALSQLYQWFNQYLQPIQQGKLTIQEATELFLKQPTTHPYW